MAYLCTEKAKYLNGAVFTVTGGGRISIYSKPIIKKEIRKDNEPWTVEELIEKVPETLLKDYISIVLEKEF